MAYIRQLISRLQESYRACLSVHDIETSTMRRPRSDLVCCATGNNTEIMERVKPSETVFVFL